MATIRPDLAAEASNKNGNLKTENILHKVVKKYGGKKNILMKKQAKQKYWSGKQLFEIDIMEMIVHI